MLESILPFSVWTMAKVFVLFAFSLYIIFSLVVVRQVGLMTRTLEVNFEKPLILFSYLHFFFAVGVFVFAFLVL